MTCSQNIQKGLLLNGYPLLTEKVLPHHSILPSNLANNTTFDTRRLKMPKKQQNYYNSIAGLVRLRHLTVCLNVGLDFLKQDMEDLDKADLNNKHEIQESIDEKLKYLFSLANELDGDIRKSFPQGGDIGYAAERLLNDESEDYNTVPTPPLPYYHVKNNNKANSSTFSRILPTLSTFMISARQKLLNYLDVSDFTSVFSGKSKTSKTNDQDNSTTDKNEVPSLSTVQEVMKDVTEAASAISNVIKLASTSNASSDDESTENSDDDMAEPKSNQIPESKCPAKILDMYMEQCKKYQNKESKETGTQWFHRMKKKKMIKVSRSTFLRRLKEYQSEEEVGKWKKKKGPKRLIDNSDIKDLLKNKNKKECISNDTIREKLSGIKRKRQAEIGKDPSLVNDVCNRTVKLYKVMGAVNTHFKVNNTTHYKSINRWIGENSIRSCVTYLFTLVTTHFIATETKYDQRAPLKDISEASEGAKKLYELVEKCNPRHHITPVNPVCIISTDDSTVYALKGKEGSKEEWVLVENEDETERDSTYSTYTTSPDADINLKGRRVRISLTINAAGEVAPIFVSVYGMTERDLPRDKFPTGVHVEKFPGLCIGATQNRQIEGYGYVCFVRKANKTLDTVSPDIVAYQEYRRLVVKPMLRNAKREIFGGEGNDDEVSEETNEFKRCVSWCDGGAPQVSAMKSPVEVSLCDLEKIIANKHSRSCSGTQQPCDVSPIFKILKQLSKYLSADKAPYARVIGIFREKFNEIEDKHQIYLGSKKEHVIDFLSILPTMMGRACSHDNVLLGFTGAGMVDKESKVFPDYKSIMNTCKNNRILEDDIQELILENFELLYNEQINKGMLTDEFLTSLGFPPDLDKEGNIVVREVSEQNEMCHRSKTLTHEYWKKLREARILLAQLKEKEEQLSIINKTRDLHLLNVKAETKLFAKLGCSVESSNTPPFINSAREHFWRVTNDELHAFTYVRTFKEYSKTNKVKMPNKGELQDVLRGLPSSINVAFSVKEKPVIMETANECGSRLNM